MTSGQCIATLTGDKKPVQSLWTAGAHLYSTAGRYMRVWDTAAPAFPCVRVLQLPHDGGSLGALAQDASGILYVAGQVGGSAAPPLWTSSLLATVQPCFLTRAACSWRFELPACMHAAGCMHSVGAAPGRQDSLVRAFRPDGSAADGGPTGSPQAAAAYESAADATSAEIDSHCGAVNALAVCGEYICSAGSDAMIRCWRTGSLELVR